MFGIFGGNDDDSTDDFEDIEDTLDGNKQTDAPMKGRGDNYDDFDRPFKNEGGRYSSMSRPGKEYGEFPDDQY